MQPANPLQFVKRNRLMPILVRHVHANDKSLKRVYPSMQPRTPFPYNGHLLIRQPHLTAATEAAQKRIMLNAPSLPIESRLLLIPCLAEAIA
jgi:hypothetical protein